MSKPAAKKSVAQLLAAISPLSLVQVSWIDSQTEQGWMNPQIQRFPDRLRPIITTGYLVHKGSNYVTITSSLGEYGGYLSPLCIPVSAIVAIMNRGS